MGIFVKNDCIPSLNRRSDYSTERQNQNLMKTLILLLFPFFLSAQVIRDRTVEIPCPQCPMDLGLVFRSSGQLELVLCIGGGRQYVLHENKLKPAGFKLLAEGVEICFDNRKIYFTNNIAYEDNKRYICSTYGSIKAI